MPEHKMVTIDGVRVRPEDVAAHRARVRAGAATGALTAAHADPRKTEGPDDPGLFDPAAHDLLGVMAHLAESDEAETARVLDAEAAAKKPRKGLTERREELLLEARTRADGGG
ncbi:hypothetical protein ACFQ7W_00785 [Streptomyces niveus]|uniref:hypothetical protein n=1 Tax=Streptomyces niveus TaxID=193462 RepID=UPI00367EA1C4